MNPGMQMDSELVNLFLKVIDGNQKSTRIAFEISNFKDRHKILRWLISNKQTGTQLETFFLENRSSILKMIQSINMRIIKTQSKETLTVADLI